MLEMVAASVTLLAVTGLGSFFYCFFAVMDGAMVLVEDMAEIFILG